MKAIFAACLAEGWAEGTGVEMSYQQLGDFGITNDGLLRSSSKYEHTSLSEVQLVIWRFFHRNL